MTITTVDVQTRINYLAQQQDTVFPSQTQVTVLKTLIVLDEDTQELEAYALIDTYGWGAIQVNSWKVFLISSYAPVFRELERCIEEDFTAVGTVVSVDDGPMRQREQQHKLERQQREDQRLEYLRQQQQVAHEERLARQEYERQETLRKLTRVPLFRLYYPNLVSHLYTIHVHNQSSESPDNHIDEGVIGYAPVNHTDISKPVFLLRNPRNGKYFLTSSSGERQQAAEQLRFEQKGVCFYVLSERLSGHACIALNRLYNAKAGRHFYTTNIPEFERLIATKQWISEGITGYLFETPKP